MSDKKIRIYSSKGSFRNIYVGIERYEYNKVFIVIDLFEDGETQKSLVIHIDDWKEVVEFIENEKQSPS